MWQSIESFQFQRPLITFPVFCILFLLLLPLWCISIEESSPVVGNCLGRINWWNLECGKDPNPVRWSHLSLHDLMNPQLANLMITHCLNGNGITASLPPLFYIDLSRNGSFIFISHLLFVFQEPSQRTNDRIVIFQHRQSDDDERTKQSSRSNAGAGRSVRPARHDSPAQSGSRPDARTARRLPAPSQRSQSY